MNSDSPVSNGTAPFVTVIMPVRNEAAYISRSLGAVLQQTYPHERMEVLIADGMSTDGTREQIHAVIANASDIPVRIIDNPKQIVPTGMNLALQAARGDVIIRVDGHCVIAPDYVSRCVEHLTSDTIDGVGGPIDTIGSDALSQAIALAMSTGFGVGGSAFRTSKQEQALVDTIPFPAYTRRAVETAGPYDELLVRNQDDEYNYRLRHLGFRLLLSPNVRSSYYSRSTLGALWRQYFQYGFYKVRVLQKHPRQMRPRQFVPVLFVAGTLSTGFLGLFLKPFRWLCLSVLVLYTAMTMFVSWSIAARKGLRLLLILPAVFATLHVSYGAGFLLGLVRFARQWRDRGYVGK